MEEEEKQYEIYEHHSRNVIVRSDLKGKHKEHCLCFDCAWFKPDEDRDANCPIANVVYANCVAHGLVTPVWECPHFTSRQLKAIIYKGVDRYPELFVEPVEAVL